jgi:hypothetical protein
VLDIIYKISSIIGITRNGKVLERKRIKGRRARQENDSISISEEARRRLFSEVNDKPENGKEREL